MVQPILQSKSEVAQSCPTLCDPTDCSLPGSSIHGMFQAKVLEWTAIASPQDLPNPGIKPRSPALQADALPSEPRGKSLYNMNSIVFTSQCHCVSKRPIDLSISQVKVVNKASVSCGATSSYLIYMYSKLRKEMREKKRQKNVWKCNSIYIVWKTSWSKVKVSVVSDSAV